MKTKMSKTKKIGILIVLLLIGGLLFDLFGEGIRTEMLMIGTSEEKRNEKLPKIDFVPNPVYSVCTDESMLESYDAMYMAMITRCEDLEGNSLLDEDHVSYTEINWMEKGQHEITYTVKDDFGQKIKKTITVILTDPIDTGH